MQQKTVISILVVLSALILKTQGLRCWTCDSARSTAECMTYGYLKTCNPNEMSCFSELRNIHGYWAVTKRCKQPEACVNNHIQNPRHASIMSQCNPALKSSVCRCCCNTDACNKVGLFCLQQQMQCRYIPKPLHGTVKCFYKNDMKEIGSTCHFSCLEGYILIGNRQATCKQVNGQAYFFPETPFCKPSVCNPAMNSIANGGVSCTDGKNIRSVCQFHCANGYALEGPSSIYCGSNGQWSAPPPQCVIPHCMVQEAPLNGRIMCDTRSLRSGTSCMFECMEGFELEGTESNSCAQDAEGFVEWNENPPVCRPIMCNPPHSPPIGGFIDCNTNNYGTICNFKCGPGLRLFGMIQSTCIQDYGIFGIWTTAAPICLNEPRGDRGHCDKPPEVENGVVTCTDGTYEHSECTVTCNEKFAPVGKVTVQCKGNAAWSDRFAKCVSTSCGELPPVINGDALCDGDTINSTCNLSCHSETFTLFPVSSNETSECLRTDDGTLAWDPPKPCCAPPCPPNIMMDFVIVMDSSSSVGDENWIVQTDFTRNLIMSFVLGPARMAIFRYNSKIDEDTEIRLNDVLEDKDEWVRRYNEIPYNGRGTKTGQAIVHARKKSFSLEYGNRPEVKDVMLVITDGKAEDTKLVKSVSKEMRAEGVLIFAIGIGVDDLTYERLTKMTGSVDRTIRADSFEDLAGNTLILKLAGILCENPCP